jgi:lysozyme
MKTSENGKQLIISFEGIKLNAYKCPAGVPTIGVGNTFYKNGNKVKIGDKITLPQAMELFESLLPKYEKTVLDAIKVPLTQNQFDALVSFCWNCGSSKTLFSMINNKHSEMNIVNWLCSHYIMGGGKVLNGLVRRRKAEAVLFVKK